MLDFEKIKTDLETNFNSEKAQGVDVSINVNVINEENGKFSVSVLAVSYTHLTLPTKA